MKISFEGNALEIFEAMDALINRGVIPEAVRQAKMYADLAASSRSSADSYACMARQILEEIKRLTQKED